MDELKSRVNLVDVLSKFISLDRKGANYWACCPFHQEKTPSFAVNSQKNFYHCFGCGKSGDAISFLMEHEHMTYPDAVVYLAKEVGMAVETEEESPEIKARRVRKERAYDALRKAARFYVDNLFEHHPKLARAYIAKRGLTRETLVAFGIGCSLDSTSLIETLEASGVSQETMRNAGLLGDYNGQPVDFEARRLVIPIIDHHGRVVAFGGRRIEEEESRNKHMKYKNTPETEVFDKRKILFGLNMMKRRQPLESLILVEGYMDVISLYQAGFTNVVASMGTSLTYEHCALLKRYVSQVYVCYDGDAAGRKATWRSLDMLTDAGLEVRVMRLPDPYDPDDIVTKFGAPAFQKLFDEALPVVDYKIVETQARFDLDTPDGKNRFVAAVLPYFAKLTPVTREIYTQKLSEITGLSQGAIENSIGERAESIAPAQTEISKKRAPRRPSPEPKRGEDGIPPEERKRIAAARFLLGSVFALAPYVEFDALKPNYFSYSVHRDVYEYFLTCIERRIRPSVEEVLPLLGEHAGEMEKIKLAYDDVLLHNRTEYYRACLCVLEDSERERRKREVLGALKSEPEGDRRESLKEELRKLISRTPDDGKQADAHEAGSEIVPQEGAKVGDGEEEHASRTEEAEPVSDEEERAYEEEIPMPSDLDVPPEQEVGTESNE